MSGVEVAGLVLSAFPLLVSSIEGYIRGVHTIARWWRFEKTLKHLLRRLAVEKVKFENTCEVLFYDIASPGQLEVLMSNPGGPEWEKTELQEKLRHRLSNSYQAYLDAVEEMSDILQSFEKRWGLRGSEPPAATVRAPAYKREWKRIQIILTESNTQAQLDLLRKNNADLETLLGHQSRMGELKRSRQRLHSGKYKDVRKRAESLHKALRIQFARRCGCGAAHRASIRLARHGEEESTKKIKAGESGSGNPSSFAVLFAFDTVSPDGGGWRRQWRESSIQHFGIPSPERSWHASSQALNTDATVAGASSGTDGADTPKMKTPVKSPHKTVTFADVPTPPLSAEKVNSLSSRQANPDWGSKDIQNLCQELRSCANEPCTLGAMSDGALGRHRVNLTKRLDLSEASRITNLQSALQGQVLKNRSERLILATKLAFTLLQLQYTPWMESAWSSRDIQLLNHGQGGVQIEHAFISLTFARLPASPRDSGISFHPRTASDIRNPALFALGMLLIELWYGLPLMELDKQNAVRGKKVATVEADVFHVASDLLDEIYRDAGEWYGDAVRRCLYCEFDQRIPSLDRDDMIEAVHRGVCEPLADVLVAFCGGKGRLEDLLR